MGVKNYYIQNNIGKAKYIISYHDGIDKYDDGSDFYNINIFKNKKYLDIFIKKLKFQGYKERYGGLKHD